jgi:isopenicillin N synthase-like dioxygenase
MCRALIVFTARGAHTSPRELPLSLQWTLLGKTGISRSIRLRVRKGRKFSTTLLRWVAQQLPSDIVSRLSMPLESMIENSAQTMLRVLHYPPVESGIELPRAAAHEDINLLTILPASDGPGLELQLSDGEWIEVVNRPSQVVVNIGDMLQETTEGFLRSTTHRVATPDEGQAASGRMSLPLFLHPRPEVTLSSRYTAESYLGERLQELGVI